MATHSSTLAWRIPGMGEPVYGVAQSWTRLSDLAAKILVVHEISSCIKCMH